MVVVFMVLAVSMLQLLTNRWGGGTIPIVARGRRETKIDWFPTSVELIKHRCCISYVHQCFEDVASAFVASLFSCCILLTEN